MKRLIILLIAFALLITACKTDGGDGGGGSDGSGGTKLTIRNQSFTEVADVIWNNVSFANNQTCDTRNFRRFFQGSYCSSFGYRQAKRII